MIETIATIAFVALALSIWNWTRELPSTCESCGHPAGAEHHPDCPAGLRYAICAYGECEQAIAFSFGAYHAGVPILCHAHREGPAPPAEDRCEESSEDCDEPVAYRDDYSGEGLCEHHAEIEWEWSSGYHDGCDHGRR